MLKRVLSQITVHITLILVGMGFYVFTVSDAMGQASSVSRGLALRSSSPATEQEDTLKFEVATIKPSSPEERGGRSFSHEGRRFVAKKATIAQLIQYAYDLQSQQLIYRQGWIDTTLYDVVGQAETKIESGDKQWKVMLRNLLEDRLALVFHWKQEILSVYALTVAKNGPKLSSSQGNPNDLFNVAIRRSGSQIFIANGTDATIADLAKGLQRVAVDRPVVDHTGLKGRFDFTLTFTYSRSMTGDDLARNDNAPSDLFVAIQQQLGLKLQPTKEPVECLVVDTLQKPEEN